MPAQHRSCRKNMLLQSCRVHTKSSFQTITCGEFRSQFRASGRMGKRMILYVLHEPSQSHIVSYTLMQHSWENFVYVGVASARSVLISLYYIKFIGPDSCAVPGTLYEKLPPPSGDALHLPSLPSKFKHHMVQGAVANVISTNLTSSSQNAAFKQNWPSCASVSLKHIKNTASTHCCCRHTKRC